MGKAACDGCRNEVPIAGGIAGLWQADPEGTGGLTLEFEDGSEHFLCFSCVESLPDYPSAADVEALRERVTK